MQPAETVELRRSVSGRRTRVLAADGDKLVESLQQADFLHSILSESPACDPPIWRCTRWESGEFSIPLGSLA
jgi:hypothetical protein